MGAVVSALAFPAPDKSISRRALLDRELKKKQLVYITTRSGLRIPAVHIQRKSSQQQQGDRMLTIVYSHGNAEDLGLSLPYLDYLSHFCGCTVFAYEYCGYSLAEGDPSEENCNECIEAAFSYLTTEKGLLPSNIVLFGRSLGTGPTIDFASKLCQKNRNESKIGRRSQQRQQQIAGVVLQSPLESAGRCVLGEFASYVLYPLDIFRSYEKIQHLKSVPVLFMHGMVDKVVPYASGQALYKEWWSVAEDTAHANAKECQPLWARDAGHNNMPEFHCMQAVSTFLEFLKTVE
mmetsp:Transcript_31077/g.75110  ORF Transcript_31077/g.75110 Transcript_31077/m.75110 type:complete len:291 (+) Transcript_31077:198-1070(+)